jgi:hypothetical protein
VNLSIGIQTHPERADLAAALNAALPSAELVVDPDPDNPMRSPWRTFRHALETTPADATHRMVIQEDAQPCRDFEQVARRAVAARPDRVLVFFVGGLPREHSMAVHRACQLDQSWAELQHMRYWCPIVCTVWPVPMIQPFLEWVDQQGWPLSFRADDEIAGRWLRHTGQHALATVPSLVEHPDLVPSMIGKRARGGRDTSRVAACFIHPDCDPLSIDWNVGPT